MDYRITIHVTPLRHNNTWKASAMNGYGPKPRVVTYLVKDKTKEEAQKQADAMARLCKGKYTSVTAHVEETQGGE